MPVGSLPATWSEDLPSGFIIEYNLDEYYRGAALIALSDRHVSYGIPSPGQAAYAQRVADLQAWATRHGWVLIQSQRKYPIIAKDGFDYQIRQPVASGWIVCTASSELSSFHEHWRPGDVVDCVSCRGQHPANTFICPTTYELIVCPSCATPNTIPVNVTVNTFGAPVYVCTECGTNCSYDGCTSLIDTRRNMQYCTQHGTSGNCVNCGVVFNWSVDDDPPASCSVGVVCSACIDCICPVCDRVAGHVDHMVWSERDEAMICPECSRQLLVTTNEDDETDDLLEFEEMETIPGRETIRKVGIEIEGGNGRYDGNHLARVLYADRLTSLDAMGGYHSGDLGFSHVERDSSVDWECVIGPVNMANDEHVDRLNRVMRRIREGVHSGHYKLDLRCGLHIHVSAEQVGLPQAYNLSHLFTYLEDPLYRIGAARWPYHRACLGNNATRTPPKYARKSEFFAQRGGRGGTHDDHYYALSFNNYFRAMTRSCGCGAAQNGFWDECECPNLPKCTFEFRLFNTTANSKKLFAYVALCQAMVAKAISMPEVRRPNEVFPGLPFVRKTLKAMDQAEREHLIDDWRPRLQYIFTELPLTDEEKHAVAYCVNNSEIRLGLGDEWREEILREEVAA